MTGDELAETKVKLINAQAEALYWRDLAARYEAQLERLEHAAADVRGAVEQFLVVLQHARPQGTDRRAGKE